MNRQLKELEEHLTKLNQCNYTLLWLEGAHHQLVETAKIIGQKLVLSFQGNMTKIITFEKYTLTTMGLQFWSQGKPGVLYRWEQVPLNRPKSEAL